MSVAYCFKCAKQFDTDSDLESYSWTESGLICNGCTGWYKSVIDVFEEFKPKAEYDRVKERVKKKVLTAKAIHRQLDQNEYDRQVNEIQKEVDSLLRAVMGGRKK